MTDVRLRHFSHPSSNIRRLQQVNADCRLSASEAWTTDNDRSRWMALRPSDDYARNERNSRMRPIRFSHIFGINY